MTTRTATTPLSARPLAQAAQATSSNRAEEAVQLRTPTRLPDVPVEAPNRAPEARPFSPAEREALIINSYDLVKQIARKIRSRLPRGVDVDDLIGYGVVGLIEAIDRYDASRSVPFEAFARPRIQGAILDALRAIDWVPRSVRRKAELLDAANEDLKENLGRLPSREELAHAVGIPVDKLDRMERGARIRSIASLDAPLSGEGDATLGSVIANDDDMLGDWERMELTDEVVDSIDRLPERERVAVQMYYLEERSLKDIGLQLGVSESRACQLRRQGVERLRFKVRHHLD
ncbi:MAG: FliA/WhiG family RNA polymerase sigma factor [Alphaproteobacteria bacterium]|nr:FliA/WhiG family RNA polymerase sigma factor [Alphaproteobacteria bacterium]